MKMDEYCCSIPLSCFSVHAYKSSGRDSTSWVLVLFLLADMYASLRQKIFLLLKSANWHIEVISFLVKPL